MCLLSPSKKIRWRAFLRSCHRNEFLRKVIIKNSVLSLQDQIQLNVLLPQMFWLFSNSPPHFRSIVQIFGNKEWFFSRHVSWTFRFNMMTINEIPVLIPSSSSYSSGRNSSLSPWDSPLGFSLRCVPISEWVLGIRSLLLIMLLNGSATGYTNSPSLWLSGVFWDIFLMHLTIPILQSQQSEHLVPKFLPTNKACPGKILQIFIHFWVFPSARRSWTFLR